MKVEEGLLGKKKETSTGGTLRRVMGVNMTKVYYIHVR
jgi:hypothetical protein